VRIVAGFLGGRIIKSPAGHRTHPMSEKARGALFNSLGDISGLSIIDAYGGSGAIGIEAHSRGAAHVKIVELDKYAAICIKENILSLDIDEAAVSFTKTAIVSWANRQQPQIFDILICDPPYDNLCLDDIQKTVRILKSDGILVISWPKKADQPKIAGYECYKISNQGDAQLYFYKKR
jgi:16S rRNA (guanine966-N2)-methyltransferase